MHKSKTASSISDSVLLISTYDIRLILSILNEPVSSQFAMVECVVTGLSDEYPKYLRRYKPFFLIGICVFMFLLAIPMCTEVRIW